MRKKITVMLFCATAIVVYSCSKKPETKATNLTSKLSENSNVVEEGMTVIFRQFVVDDLFQMFVPTTLELKGPASNDQATLLTIVALKYLRGSSDRKGTLIAVAFPGIPNRLPNFVSKLDDEKPLDAVGRDLLSESESPAWLVVMKLSADWGTSKLTLTVLDGQAIVAKKSEDVSVPPYLSEMLQNKEAPVKVKEVDTSDITVKLSDDRQISIKAQGDFFANRSAVYMFPAAYSIKHQPTTALTFDNIPDETNVIAEVRPDFIKDLLKKAYAEPFVFGLPGSDKTISLKEFEYDVNTEIDPEKSFFSLTAKRELEQKSWFRVKAQYGGDDAKQQKLEMVGSFNCGDLSPSSCIKPKAEANLLVGLARNTMRGKPLRSNGIKSYTVRVSQDINRLIFTKYNRIFVSGQSLFLYSDWRGNLNVK